MMLKKIWIAVALVLWVMAPFAQTLSPRVQPSTGGYFTGGNLQLQFTVGEPLTATFTSGGNEFSLGFEQPELNIVADSIAVGPYCAGSQISVPFIAQGIFAANNIFTLQLSNASGSFASPMIIGADTTTHSGTITATIPSGTAGGSNYRFRVGSLNPVFTGYTANVGATITINPAPAPTTPYAKYYWVCNGDSTYINIPNSQQAIHYILWQDSSAVDSIVGNGYNVTMQSTGITASSKFIVAASDTTNGCNLNLFPTITVAIDSGPPAPFFVMGDTVLMADSSSTYVALSMGSANIIYSIDSGGASIDSLLGTVTGVTSDFLVRATAIGIGCAATHSLLYVRVAHTGDSIVRMPLRPQYAQQGNMLPPAGEWEFTAGSTSEHENWTEAVIETTDGDGSYIVVGYSPSNNPGNLGQFLDTKPSILKLSGKGKPIWHTVVDQPLCGAKPNPDFAFEEVIEVVSGPTVGGGVVKYVAAGQGTFSNLPGDNNEIFVAEFDANGNDLADRIIYNKNYGGRDYGNTHITHMALTPAGDGLIISGYTDEDVYNTGQKDLLLFGIPLDLSIIPTATGVNQLWWKHLLGYPSAHDYANCTGGDFVVSAITGGYNVYIVGGKYNSSATNTTSYANTDYTHTFTPGELTSNHNNIILDKIDVLTPAGSGWPAISTDLTAWTPHTINDDADYPVEYDFTSTTNIGTSSYGMANYYHALNPAPYKDGATPGHSNPAVNFFQNSHYDSGRRIIIDPANPTKFLILAQLNAFSNDGNGRLPGIYTATTNLHSFYPDPVFDADNIGDYKEMDLALFRTDMTGVPSGPAVQVMHCSGFDYIPGLAADATGNIYVSGTTADDNNGGIGWLVRDNTVNRWRQGAVTAVNGQVVTAMHMKKLDTNLSTLWEFTRAGHKPPWNVPITGQPGITTYTPAIVDPNYYASECCFAMCLNDEGGFVMTGNNYSRWEDYAIHKFYSDCEPNMHYNIRPHLLGQNWGDIDCGGGTLTVNAKITIQSGQSLTFSNGTLEFANTRQVNDLSIMDVPANPCGIYIEPGGKLTLNGITLRGMDNCYGNRMQWDGIVLTGNNGSTQTATNQGSLVMENNAQVEDAVNGVMVNGVYFAGDVNPAGISGPWSGFSDYDCEDFSNDFVTNQVSNGYSSHNIFSWILYRQDVNQSGQGGGILTAGTDVSNPASFLNCSNGVTFGAYANTNTSTLNYATFNENAYMAEPLNRNTIINAHLALDGVAGVNINNSTFEMDNTFYSGLNVGKRGVGILDFNSTYTVGSSTDATNINTFQNLTYGIQHINVGSAWALNCFSAAFTNNQVGLETSNTQNDAISNNTFSTPAAYFDGIIPIYGIGLITSSSSLFEVCSNTFTNYSSYYTYIGSWIINSGSNASSVSSNPYSGNGYGLSTTYDNSGLFFRKNNFSANYLGVTLNVDEGASGYRTQDQDNLTGNDVPEDVFSSTCDLAGGFNIATGDVYNPSLGGTAFKYQPLTSSSELNLSCAAYWDGSGFTTGDNSSIDKLTPPGVGSVPVVCNGDLGACYGCKMLVTVPDPKSVTITERAQQIKQLLANAPAGQPDMGHTAKVASIVQYLENFNDWRAQQLLVPAYYELGQIGKMKRCISGIAQTGEDINNFKVVYSLLGNARAQGRTESKLTDDEWNTLRTFAKANKTSAGAVANNLLLHYKKEYNPPIPSFYKIKNVQESVVTAPNSAVNNNLVVYPNPMNEATTFKYLLPEDGSNNQKNYIIVSNVLGERIAEYPLAYSFGAITFNRADLEPAVYFCTLMQGHHLIAIQKFVKE